jgi:two-component system response regulator QseB
VDIRFSGESGVEAAEKNSYDAILIDYGLPGLNGVEVLLRIKRIEPRARCFLLTGHRADDVSVRGMEAGALDILTKPIDPEELSRRLSGVEEVSDSSNFMRDSAKSSE